MIYRNSVDLLMHIDIFTGIFMVSLLHLVQFSHLTFQECYNELCGVFGIPRNSIFFHEINSSSDTVRHCARRPF